MDFGLKVKLAIAWIASRLMDSFTTWYILKNRLGRELNPIAVKFMEYFGLELGLVVFTIVGMLLGIVLLIIIPRLLRCEWCMTPFDRMIFSVLSRERVAAIIMYTAVALSFVPGFTNFLLIILFNIK